ncbi:DUF1853 family protein [Neiella sp. HB171785]|uniref:DUF1853 family protein n=1 Tax=Neiella litorisoli TaxID=2771431 RepID=A0A8J6QHG9_9GAMM|nr:DUF1853 family protein [Neiella litorisoli]MBD1388512.1 DUF1853 family protein [Neiella litorisoli]
MKDYYEIIEDLQALLTQTSALDQTLPYRQPAGWLEHFRQRLLDHQPDLLIIAKQVQLPHSPRLGLYVEQLWLALINSHPDYQLLSHNLQITADKQTIGAFDFLLRHCPAASQCQQGRIEHWELACKYYLAVSPDDEQQLPPVWLGPNLNDDWISKRNKLLAKQIRLGEQPAAQAVLSTLGIDHIDQKMILASGRVFKAAEQLQLPRDGHWYTQHQWQLLDHTNTTYEQAKLDWIQPKLAGQWIDCSTDRLTKPVFVTTVLACGQLVCCFIVPDDWPAKAQKKAAAISAAAL